MKTTRALKFLLGASALSLPLLANSESNYQNGAGALTATAHVDFSVVIPKILYLRVGTGSAYATTAALASVNTIDLITFAPALGAVGNGVAVPGTGGDIATGGETAALVSNAGNVVLSATATGMLTDATGDTISFAQIATTSAANTLATTLAAPPLSNTTAAITVVAAANKLINADAKWTFAYANTAAVPGGTYGGVNLNNSRIVYTATMP
ncbi:MAG: hypothetical protein WB440_04790 [Steroidobacteraceae bacterium]|jgi:hypothetical protein